MEKQEQIKQVINNYHRDRMGNTDGLNMNESFHGQGYDSLDFVEMVIEVEKQLDMQIPDEKIEPYSMMSPEEFINAVTK